MCRLKLMMQISVFRFRVGNSNVSVCKYAIHKKCKDKVTDHCGAQLKVPNEDQLKRSVEILQQDIADWKDSDEEELKDKKRDLYFPIF